MTAVVGLRAGALALNLVVALQLGRMLGVSSFGAYAAGIGLAQILSVLVSLGGGPLVVRGTAAYLASRDAALLRGLLARALQAVLAGSCLVAAAIAGVLLSTGSHSVVTSAMIAGAALVPLLALAVLGQAVLQGLQRMVAAFGPPTVGRPVAMVLMLAILAVAGTHLSATGAVLLQGASIAVGLGLTGVLVSRSLPRDVRRAAPAYATRSWVRSGAAIGLTTGLTAVGLNVGVTLTAAIGGAREAGLLGAATRVSVVVLLLAWAAAEALQPAVARLYASHEIAELQRVVTRTTRYVAGGTVVAAVGAAVLAQPLLDVFGSGFADGATALRLLCLAAVVNALTAPNMTLLLMTEHERGAAAAAAAGVAMTGGLGLLLIPAFGAAGGAAAYVLGSVVRNASASYWTWRRLGIDSTVVGARMRSLTLAPVRES
jgi:O-antigen/teichoic acid export membrane protein